MYAYVSFIGVHNSVDLRHFRVQFSCYDLHSTVHTRHRIGCACHRSNTLVTDVVSTAVSLGRPGSRLYRRLILTASQPGAVRLSLKEHFGVSERQEVYFRPPRRIVFIGIMEWNCPEIRFFRRQPGTDIP